ncbi:MAG: FKBP-type peptidyl-prolyl cis-trans isomerase [Bacteroidales bacterium]|jgi:FKBP-type peptidyl-prolyl cis-trans isomerase|nr:FKBP-type peptidyl-prolyl cis-trans isomerase [Bacteroidales bacterium]
MKLNSILVLSAASVIGLSACNSGGIGGSANLSTNADSAAYFIGFFAASQYYQTVKSNPEGDKLDKGLIIKGFIDTYKKMDDFDKKSEEEQQETMELANTTIMAYFEGVQKRVGEKNLAEEQEFLEKNKAKEGVITTESGLQYEILREGTGPKPTATQTVEVHYHGTLPNGEVFDSSVDKGEPVKFPVNGVIPGWTEALQLMPVGSKWKLYIPSAIGYGDKARSEKIGPNQMLIFEVELLGIEPDSKEDAHDHTH